MKKLSIILSFLFVATLAFAQQNLRDGYVITLEGDTLHGVIDFRTSAMNAKRCVFKQEGESEFKTYLPGEIDGYRFTSNGIYYVSRNVTNEAGTREMVFAEYVLRGSMSLYQIGEDEMVIVDEDGKEASFSLEKARNATTVLEMGNALRDVMALFNKSDKASQMLWRSSKNRSNTKKAVMTYVDDVCMDGTCEAFEYKSKNTPKEDKIVRPWVKAGMKVTSYKFWDDRSLTGCSPRISAGADFHINRLLRGLMVNVGVSFEPGRASTDASKNYQGEPSSQFNGYYVESVTFNQFDIFLGPGYQFQTGPVKTHVKAGYIFRPGSRSLTFTEDAYYFRGHEYDSHVTKHSNDLKFDSPFGLYGGVGVEYPLKSFSLTCDLEYIYGDNSGQLKRAAGQTIIVQEIKQHGVCLSVGVKF